MMEEQNMKNFNPTREIYNLIGSICQNTELLKSQEVDLKVDDFMQKIHKVVFGAINNIVYNASGDNVTTVSAKDVDNYLSSLPTQYKIFNDQKGYEYIEQCISHANEETFKQSYDRVKKMSILRKYQTMGFDVSELYEWNSDDYLAREKSLLELDKKQLKDIFEYFTLRQLQIKDSFNIETNSKKYRAGDNVKELLERCKRGVEYGAPYDDGFSNYLLRGQRRGKLVIRSAGTGGLKTSLQIRDMAHNSLNKLYRNGEWKFNGVKLPSLFISTELDIDELTIIVLAYMTGIPRKVIQDGKYNKQQNDLLLEAGEIMSESPFYLVHIPDFSVGDIEEIIERHILDYDVGYIAMDYIQVTPKLARTTNEMFGSIQREDQILLNLSSSLKTLSERYNVHITSATQINRNSKDEDNWDSTSVRGGSSIIDKCDAAFILRKTKQKDLEKVQSIIEENGFGKEPNYQKILYKNRSGISNVIMWSYLDFSTVMETPLFCTDTDYNIIEDIEDLHFSFTEEKDATDLKEEEKYAGDKKTEIFGHIDIQMDNIDF